MVTEVAAKTIGKAQAVYNFDGRKFNELPLQKVINTFFCYEIQ